MTAYDVCITGIEKLITNGELITCSAEEATIVKYNNPTNGSKGILLITKNWARTNNLMGYIMRSNSMGMQETSNYTPDSTIDTYLKLSEDSERSNIVVRGRELKIEDLTNYFKI